MPDHEFRGPTIYLHRVVEVQYGVARLRGEVIAQENQSLLLQVFSSSDPKLVSRGQRLIIGVSQITRVVE